MPNNTAQIIDVSDQLQYAKSQTNILAGKFWDTSLGPNRDSYTKAQSDAAWDATGANQDKIKSLDAQLSTLIRTNTDVITAQDDSPAVPAEIMKEIAQVPGVPGVRILTVQSDGLFQSAADAAGALPAAAAAGVASVSQKSSELMRAVGGQGVASTVTPQNAGSKLIKPNKTTSDFMLKLTSKSSNEQIIFNVTPTIDESRTANYEHLNLVHHPGTIQVYKSTDARLFNISVKLIARTSAEATVNITYLNRLRAWVMPYYGQGTADSEDGSRIGAPPDILSFDVYGDKNISNIPVVLTSYHWVYPDSCDYIPTLDGIPFPTIMDISLSIVEAYSPEQYSSFNLVEYRNGNMLGAYTFSATPN